MKKFSVLGVFILATTSQMAFADVGGEGKGSASQVQAECPKAFEGFYIGGNIGYGTASIKHQFRSPAGTFRAHSNLSAKGVDGGLGVGYMHRICAWAFGLAFDANWAGTKGNSKVDFPPILGQPSYAHSSVRLKNSLQLYGKLGYVLRDMALPFIALGWDNSQWKESASIRLGPLFTNHASKSKRLNGLLWKVGMDFLATRSIIFGFEYTGTIAQRQKVTISRTILGQNATFTGSFKPQYNKFALTAKVVY
jgi:opacity protein-like surface antigen